MDWAGGHLRAMWVLQASGECPGFGVCTGNPGVWWGPHWVVYACRVLVHTERCVTENVNTLE